MAGRLALCVVQLAAAPLYGPREPAPARGGAPGRRAGVQAGGDGRGRPRLRGGLRGLRGAPAHARALLVPQVPGPGGLTEAGAAIVRDELVRIEGLPLVVRAVGLPASAP